MNVLRAAIVGGLLCLATSATWAAPHLQLYIDPSQNSDAAYNSISKGWETSANPMTLSAFMHGLDPTHTYRIIVSLPGRSAENNPNEKIIVTVSDATGQGVVASLDTWTFGAPALSPGSDASSFHIALFPTWYATFDFTFSPDNKFSVFDVCTRQGETPGYRKDFLLTFSGPQGDTFYHFDLFDVDTGEFAPLTHDAQRKRKKSSHLFPPLALGFSGGGIGWLSGGGHANEPVSGSPGSTPSGGGSGSGGGDATSPFGPGSSGGGRGGDSGGSGGSQGSTGGGSGGGASGSSGSQGGNGGGNPSRGSGSPPVSVIENPEPSTIILLLTGAAVFLVIQHRRRDKRQKA